MTNKGMLNADESLRGYEGSLAKLVVVSDSLPWYRRLLRWVKGVGKVGQ